MTELQILTGSIADLEWFQEHSNEIRDKHSGEFVAIKNKSIVGFALSSSALIKNLEKNGEDSNLVLIKHVTPKGEIVIL